MTNQLATTHATTTLPTPADWNTLTQMADCVVRSGLAPQSVQTPQAALVIMIKGRELGIAALQALNSISVIKGKPVCSAELLLAVIYRDHGDNAIKIDYTDENRCTIAYKRRQWDESQEYSFTIEDAKKAGLLGNPTWSKYPQAMLRARCISAVARMAFPDSIGGLYSAEEMGAEVTVTDDGAVEMVQGEVMEEPKPALPLRGSLKQIEEQRSAQTEVIELADADEIALFNEIRTRAIAAGYTTAKGGIPKEASADTAKAKCLNGIRAMDAFLKDSPTPVEQEAAQLDEQFAEKIAA